MTGLNSAIRARRQAIQEYCRATYGIKKKLVAYFREDKPDAAERRELTAKFDSIVDHLNEIRVE